MPSLNAPLWPAGHLPLKGGDRMFDRLSTSINGAGCAAELKPPISPLEGEMPGRAEGGAS
ncbi:lytic murein transglycosylase [Mesorhizobium sp. B2-3-12]|nr:lytic murein transglycosylase [Mesorhizobium sp. B2-3-12]